MNARKFLCQQWLVGFKDLYIAGQRADVLANQDEVRYRKPEIMSVNPNKFVDFK